MTSIVLTLMTRKGREIHMKINDFQILKKIILFQLHSLGMIDTFHVLNQALRTMNKKETNLVSAQVRLNGPL